MSIQLKRGESVQTLPPDHLNDTKRELHRAKTHYGNLDNEYTWEEVAQHNTDKSAWVIYKNDVCDVSDFIEKHPGGRDMILLMAGRDVTDVLPSYHPFTEKPYKILDAYKIGTLKGPSEYGRFQEDSGFYGTLRHRVADFFEKNGYDYKDPSFGAWRYLLIMTCIISGFLVAYTTRDFLPFRYRFYSMIFAGVFQGMLLIHTMHDCSHTALSHKPWVWKYMGRMCMDITCGTSFDAWLHQHVVGHHVYTNILGVDPDMPMEKKDDVRRMLPLQEWAPRYKFQYIYLPLLYCVYAFKNRIQDLSQTLFGGYNGAMRVNPYFRDTESLVRQIISKTLWAIRVIYVPLFVFNVPFHEFIVLFLTMELTTGYFLTYNFQVSHVSTDMEWPEAVVEENGKKTFPGEWAKLQVETSVDYGYNWWCTFFSGALNCQTIHHLFPCVSQYWYPSIAPIVRQTCKEYGVKFHYYDSFYAAFRAHLRQLYDMSFDPAVAKKINVKLRRLETVFLFVVVLFCTVYGELVWFILGTLSTK